LSYVSSPPEFEKAGNTNVFVGNLLIKLFHVVRCKKACAALEIYWNTPWGNARSFKNQWFRGWNSS